MTRRRFRSRAAFGSAISIRFQRSRRDRARRRKTRKCAGTNAFRQRGSVAAFAWFPTGGMKPSHKWEKESEADSGWFHRQRQEQARDTTGVAAPVLEGQAATVGFGDLPAQGQADV